jgi:GntR family transcriptional regulator/MocR family aminotransferase
LADQLKSAVTRHAGAAPGARTLHEWLKSQVADGSLAVGASRTTVTAAYEQLAAEGYLETAPGSRARVAAGAAQRSRARSMPAAAQRGRPRLSSYGQRVDALASAQPSPAGNAEPGLIDFLYGALAFDDFPTLAWRRAYNRAIVQRQPSLSYDAPEGEPALRTALRLVCRPIRSWWCRARSRPSTCVRACWSIRARPC